VWREFISHINDTNLAMNQMNIHQKAP